LEKSSSFSITIRHGIRRSN